MSPAGPVLSESEFRGKSIAAFVRKHDELVAENKRLQEELDELTQVTTVAELADLLDRQGFVADDFTHVVLENYAFNNPDWVRHGFVTALGAEFIRLSDVGLVFTRRGVRAVLEQYGTDQ